jgi:hypothetical protein
LEAPAFSARPSIGDITDSSSSAGAGLLTPTQRRSVGSRVQCSTSPATVSYTGHHTDMQAENGHEPIFLRGARRVREV